MMLQLAVPMFVIREIDKFLKQFIQTYDKKTLTKNVVDDNKLKKKEIIKKLKR